MSKTVGNSASGIERAWGTVSNQDFVAPLGSPFSPTK
jgi:hypothetical protein